MEEKTTTVKSLCTKIDANRLVGLMEGLINTPSVVGYYPQIHEYLEVFAREYGYTVTYDNRHTAYIYVEGENPGQEAVVVGAHLDTIGMVVRSISEQGWLNVRNLGGVNFHSVEGENVYVHTRHNGTYSGMLINQSHSVHVFDDARSREREFDQMAVVIDEDVHTKEQVEALDVRPGDLISVEPRFVMTDSGYIKSRHIDDKANAAILLELLALFAENKIKPAYNTYFAFPINEEIGMGGRYVPKEATEYLALDIGLVGGQQAGDEKKVSICGADRVTPYDWALTTELADLAEKYGIDSVLDIYYRYSSDASAALQADNNLAPACIGMGCMTSHGYERTHMDGVLNTAKLTLAYLLDRSLRERN
ncbi:M20/M25/M40 family metallo-hydrolase [Erysipelotrichaceae bacterium RD49]|nr:M20/M25/M40 family metallo-hydrolase [Erysipelotrichaceae bacterium RD49]